MSEENALSSLSEKRLTMWNYTCLKVDRKVSILSNKMESNEHEVKAQVAFKAVELSFNFCASSTGNGESTGRTFGCFGGYERNAWSVVCNECFVDEPKGKFKERPFGT